MMFLIMIFLIYNQKMNKTNFGLFSQKSNTFTNKINDPKYNGFDYRYETNVTKNHFEKEMTPDLYKIYNHFQNKKLLDILKNENVSIITKMILLEDNRIKSSNLYAGGLMKEFDFEF